MPAITYVEPHGREIVVELADGETVMHGAIRNGVDGIEAQCGGACACGTCHCYVVSGYDTLPLPSDYEDVMLSTVASERLPNSRLACQITPTVDLTVRLPDRQT